MSRERRRAETEPARRAPERITASTSTLGDTVASGGSGCASLRRDGFERREHQRAASQPSRSSAALATPSPCFTSAIARCIGSTLVTPARAASVCASLEHDAHAFGDGDAGEPRRRWNAAEHPRRGPRLRCIRARLGAEDVQHLGARLVERDAGVDEHLGAQPLRLAKDPEQQMLRPDVAVVERTCLRHGVLERLLRARGVGQVGPRLLRLAALLDDRVDVGRQRVHVDREILQHRGRHALALAQNAEEDVLRADVVVAQASGFLARHRQHLPHALGEVVAVHRSAQLLLICRQSAHTSLHLRHSRRAEPQ